MTRKKKKKKFAKQTIRVPEIVIFVYDFRYIWFQIPWFYVSLSFVPKNFSQTRFSLFIKLRRPFGAFIATSLRWLKTLKWFSFQKSKASTWHNITKPPNECEISPQPLLKSTVIFTPLLSMRIIAPFMIDWENIAKARSHVPGFMFDESNQLSLLGEFMIMKWDIYGFVLKLMQLRKSSFGDGWIFHVKKSIQIWFEASLNSFWIVFTQL